MAKDPLTPSPPPPFPKPSDAQVLAEFPGDLDRAHRLSAALQELRWAVADLERKFSLSVADSRAVLQALLVSKPIGPQGEFGPADAPEKWSERRRLFSRDNPPDFIRRVYGQWLGRGLARKDIARLDPELYRALAVWLNRHPDDEIGRLLPTQSEQLDELIERLSAEYPVEVLRKLGYAIDTRLRRQ
jgi:hypothetical protein